MLKALTGPITDLKLRRDDRRTKAASGPDDETHEAGNPGLPEPNASETNPAAPADDSVEARAEALVTDKKRDSLEYERAGLRLWRTKLLFLSFIVPILAWLFLFPSDNDLGAGGESLNWRIIGLALFVEAFFVVSLLAARTRLSTIRTELQRVEYETLLRKLRGPDERTAANLFFKHQFELKQYYDQALRQHRQAFALGVTCVLFGLGVIVAAISVVAGDPEGGPEVVIGVLGGVGALLSGAVASIYLVMYAGATQSLQTFHQRLVKTNRLHLAYLFATTIDDPQSQERTVEKLAELAVTTNDELEPS